MLYNLIRPFAKIALGLYFRKIYIANREAIPLDKPVILAANHPTAFIEPCILACWLEQPLSFIARGDLYVNSLILRKIYDWVRMTPIFRQEDTGYSNLKSNYETFEKCYETLEKKMPLMILVEGRTIHEKRIRPIKKGTARIVFGALDKHQDLDIHIVPVGVNYTNSDQFRSVAMIEFGEPIRCAKYNHVYEENPAKAVNQLTKEIGEKLKDKIVQIDKKQDDELVEMFLSLEENEIDSGIYPVSSSDSQLFVSQKNVADRINEFSPEEKQNLKIKADNYYHKLAQKNISDFGLMHRNYASFKNTLFAILGFLPAMVGYILNAPPIWLGNFIAKKIAPSIEFRAATAIVFSSFLYIFYGIGLYLSGYLIGFGWWVFLLMIIPVLGYFYIGYQEIIKKWWAGRKANKLNSEVTINLIKDRNELKKMLQ
jgi:1-acyl-sn-glycerol-3-phosphate acyltransferase